MTDYQAAIQGMKDMMSDPDKLIGSFNRGGYKAGFQTFYMQQVPVFDCIEQLYESVVDKDTMIANMADAFVSDAAAFLEAASKRKKESVRINQALVIAAFVFPAILKYKGNSSRPLLEAIQKRWKEEFPKSNLSAAEFEDIEKGFHRKWCYITTAACEVLGMEDHCEELDLLRAYRDTYMMQQENGEQLIHDYYDVAPSIVKHIDMKDNRVEIYRDIWDRYIDPCITDIREGRMDACMSTYSDMVLEMKEQYFHLYPRVESEHDE